MSHIYKSFLEAFLNIKILAFAAFLFSIVVQTLSATSALAQNTLINPNSASKSTENSSLAAATNSQESQKNPPLIDQAKGELAEILLGQNKIKSLMFDDQELGHLEKAISSFRNNQVYVPPEDENSLNQSKENDPLNKIVETNSQENEKSYIYLASIMYFNSKNWVVWINDKKITSEENSAKKELFIESISSGEAKILWKLSLSKWRVISGKAEELAPKTNSDNQIEIHFSLKPNQTFVLSSNKVTEGKAFISQIAEKAETAKTAEKTDSAEFTFQPLQ